jgi:hypothetical protein
MAKSKGGRFIHGRNDEAHNPENLTSQSFNNRFTRINIGDISAYVMYIVPLPLGTIRFTDPRIPLQMEAARECFRCEIALRFMLNIQVYQACLRMEICSLLYIVRSDCNFIKVFPDCRQAIF